MEGRTMNTTTKRRRDFPPFATAPTDYVALCDLYLPRPIHSKADARAAAQVVESLAGHALSEGQEDYLEIIVTVRWTRRDGMG